MSRLSPSGRNEPGSSGAVLRQTPATGTIDLDPEGTGFIASTGQLILTLAGNTIIRTLAAGTQDGQKLTLSSPAAFQLSVTLQQPAPVLAGMSFPNNTNNPGDAFGLPNDSTLDLYWDAAASLWRLQLAAQLVT